MTSMLASIKLSNSMVVGAQNFCELIVRVKQYHNCIKKGLIEVTIRLSVVKQQFDLKA